jgi:hypothetical protein
MMQLRTQLRAMFESGEEPASFEAASQRVVTFFRNELVDAEGRPACALVRIYKTHLFETLPDDLMNFARQIEPGADAINGLRCLTLVATAGDEEAWNSRVASNGHRAIPLSSERAVARAPMVARLFQQMGVDVAAVLRPDPALMLDVRDKAQGVFYVPTAEGSPYIVAQKEFVMRYGIASVIGFGGLLASGDLVAAILFSKVRITPEAADQFKVIGLNFKLAMLPFARKQTFKSSVVS